MVGLSQLRCWAAGFTVDPSHGLKLADSTRINARENAIVGFHGLAKEQSL